MGDPRLSQLPPPVAAKLVQAIEFSASLPAEPPIEAWDREEALYDAALAPIGLGRLEHANEPLSERPIALASELTPEQRAAVAILADIVGPDFARFPIYNAAWLRRRWIGAEPPGVLFRDIGGVPLFHALRVHGSVGEKRALAATRTLPLVERLELACELSLAQNDYWTNHTKLSLELPTKLDRAVRAWAPAFADRLLALTAASPRPDRVSIDPKVSRAVLLAVIRTGVTLEARWHGLIDLFMAAKPIVFELCGAIPEAQRGAVMRASLERVAFVNDAVDRALEVVARWPMPEVASFALAQIDRARRPKQVIEMLRKLGKRRPAIAAVLAAYEREAVADRELGMVRSTLDRLDAAARAQLEASAQRYNGDTRSAADILAGAGDDGEGLARDAIERWRVLAGAQHVYDAWLYMGDSGTFFDAGTTNVIAEVIQGGVESSDPSLARSLRQAMTERRNRKTPRRTRRR